MRASALTLLSRSYIGSIKHYLYKSCPPTQVSFYQSKSYAKDQDVDSVYSKYLAAREKVMAAMAGDSMKDAARRLFPLPCDRWAAALAGCCAACRAEWLTRWLLHWLLRWLPHRLLRWLLRCLLHWLTR